MKRFESQLGMELAMAISPQRKQPVSYADWVRDKAAVEWRQLKAITSEVPELLRWSIQVTSRSDETAWYAVEAELVYEVVNQNDWRSKRNVPRLHTRFGVPFGVPEPAGLQWFWIDFGEDFGYWLERGYFIAAVKMQARFYQPQQSPWYRLTVPVRISLG